MSIKSISQPFYYVDRQGVVKEDSYRGVFAPISRLITGLWRDYNLFNVHNALSKTSDSMIQKAVSRQIAKKCGITDKQYKALKGMSKGKNRDYSEFLGEIQGNRKFNANVSLLIKNTKGLSTVSLETLQDVSAYSFKTKQSAEMIRVAEKANSAFEKFRQGVEVSAEDKLTIPEVRILESVARMETLFDKWKTYHTTDVSFAKLHEAAQISSEFISTMQAEAEAEANGKFDQFGLYDMETDYALRGQKTSSIQRYIFKKILGTNISHISVIWRNSIGRFVESHLWGSPVSKYSMGQRTLGNLCFHTFRISSMNMADNSNKLDELYVTDCEKTIQNKYEKICQSYFSDKSRFEQLYNPVFKRVLAAIGIKFSWLSTNWEEQCNFPKSNQVICSEFAVLSTLQCLKELNKEIADDWKAAGLQGDAPKLNPPIRQGRRLNRVIPHEVIKEALDRKIGSIQAPAKCIQAVIKCNNKVKV